MYEEANNRCYDIMCKVLKSRFEIITPTVIKFIGNIRVLYGKLNTNFK